MFQHNTKSRQARRQRAAEAAQGRLRAPSFARHWEGASAGVDGDVQQREGAWAEKLLVYRMQQGDSIWLDIDLAN